jgi:threonine dehydratase
VQTVTFADIRRARDVIAPHLPPTPIWSYPALDALAGATVHIKHENAQPVGAFKVRGGLNLLATSAAAEGLVTYSTGNHAQSIAYACRVYGVPCVVVMPAAANEAKVRAIRALGATVELCGAELADAQAHAEKLAADRGWRLVSPGDEPALIAGVGTVALEAFESVSDVDFYLVPVGSGTGAAGQRSRRPRWPRAARSSGYSPTPRRPGMRPGVRGNRPTVLTGQSSRVWPPGAASNCRRA